MSMWTDESGGEALDGPLTDRAPAHDAETPDDDLLVPVGAAEEWTPEQGYPDSSRSVRIWMDDEKRLTKVRISNRWRDRAKGTSLSSMFDEAFLLANATLGSSVPPATASAAETPQDTPLSWEALDAVLAETARLDRESAELDEHPEEVTASRWIGASVEGYNAQHTVGVRLSLHGRTEKVDFSEQWLRQARVSEVCDGIMEAHRDAYTRFSPPTYEPGDRERLAGRYARLQEQIMALMSARPTTQGGPR